MQKLKIEPDFHVYETYLEVRQECWNRYRRIWTIEDFMASEFNLCLVLHYNTTSLREHMDAVLDKYRLCIRSVVNEREIILTNGKKLKFVMALGNDKVVGYDRKSTCFM